MKTGNGKSNVKKALECLTEGCKVVLTVGGVIMLGAISAYGQAQSSSTNESQKTRETKTDARTYYTPRVHYKPWGCFYEVGYGDAISAIANSDMSSWYKDSAMRSLKRDETMEYYRAVIGIAESETSDYYRASSIRGLK